MWNKEQTEKQFVAAYDKHSDAIFRYCYYRVFDKEKAQDYMQEAFSRTWEYLMKGGEIENIRAFVYRTASNIIIDESRKKKSLSLDTLMESGFTPNVDTRESTQDYFSSQEVIAIIQSLSEKYRDVLLLKYVDEFSTKEIAEIIGEKENNVYIRLHRGIAQVKEAIEQKELRVKNKQNQEV